MVAGKKGDGLRYRGKGQGGRAAGVGAAMPQQPQQAPAGPQVPGGDKGHGGASALLPEAWFELYMLASGAAQLLYFTGMYFKPADVPYHIHLPSLMLVILFHCHRIVELCTRNAPSAAGITLDSPLTICYFTVVLLLTGYVMTARSLRQSAFLAFTPVLWLFTQWLDTALCRRIHKMGSAAGPESGGSAPRGSTRSGHKGKGRAAGGKGGSRGGAGGGGGNREAAEHVQAVSSLDYEGCIALELQRCVYIPTLQGILCAYICVVLPVTSVRNPGLYYHALSCAVTAALVATQSTLMYIMQRLSWKMVWTRWANMLGYWEAVGRQRIHPAFVDDLEEWNHLCCYSRGCVVIRHGLYWAAYANYNIGCPGSWVVTIINKIICPVLFPAVAIIVLIQMGMMISQILLISRVAWWRPISVNFLATLWNIFLGLYVRKEFEKAE